MKRRWLWLLAPIALLALLAGFTWWVVASDGGARWSVAQLVRLLDGKLNVGELHGALSGPITLINVRYYDPNAGVDVHIERARLDWELGALWHRRVRVTMLETEGVDVRLFVHPPKTDDSEFSLRAPIDLIVDKLTLRRGRVRQDGNELVVLRSAEFGGAWLRDKLTIDKLIVDSPDGHVRLAGQSATEIPYDGHARGEFRWRVADKDFAGSLTATGQRSSVRADLRLSAPLEAHATVTLRETRELPWTIDLAVPRFDPRERLLTGSSLESLAATLHGEGDRQTASVRGATDINGQRVYIESFRGRFEAHEIRIEELELLDAQKRGALHASGEVHLPESNASIPAPLRAELDLRWENLVLPKQWVGQPLGTHGKASVKGSLDQFAARAKFAIGPPGRLADIEVELAGTPQEIALRRRAPASTPRHRRPTHSTRQ